MERNRYRWTNRAGWTMYSILLRLVGQSHRAPGEPPTNSIQALSQSIIEQILKFKKINEE